MDDLEFPHDLTCICLDCGRKSDYHADNRRFQLSNLNSLDCQLKIFFFFNNVNNIVRLQTLLCHFSTRCFSVQSCNTRTNQLSGTRMWRDHHWLVDNIKWHCNVILWAGDVRSWYFYRLVLFCNKLLSRLLAAGISISMDGAPVHYCVLSGCHKQEGGHSSEGMRGKGHWHATTWRCSWQINKSTRRGSVTSCHYADGFQGEVLKRSRTCWRNTCLKYEINENWLLAVENAMLCHSPLTQTEEFTLHECKLSAFGLKKENKPCEFRQPVFIHVSPENN